LAPVLRDFREEFLLPRVDLRRHEGLERRLQLPGPFRRGEVHGAGAYSTAAVVSEGRKEPAMDLSFTPEEQAVRGTVRSFVASCRASAPTSTRGARDIRSRDRDRTSRP